MSLTVREFHFLHHPLMTSQHTGNTGSLLCGVAGLFFLLHPECRTEHGNPISSSLNYPLASPSLSLSPLPPCSLKRYAHRIAQESNEQTSAWRVACCGAVRRDEWGARLFVREYNCYPKYSHCQNLINICPIRSKLLKRSSFSTSPSKTITHPSSPLPKINLASKHLSATCTNMANGRVSRFFFPSLLTLPHR